MNRSEPIKNKHGSITQLGRMGSNLWEEQYVNKTETTVGVIPIPYSSASL